MNTERQLEFLMPYNSRFTFRTKNCWQVLPSQPGKKKKGQQPFPCETTTHYFHWKKVHLLSPWLLYFLGLYQTYCQLWQMVFHSTWATTVIQIPRRAFHLLFICIPISFRLLAKLFFLICHFHSSGVAKEKQTVYKLNANHLWIEECVNVSGLF